MNIYVLVESTSGTDWYICGAYSTLEGAKDAAFVRRKSGIGWWEWDSFSWISDMTAHGQSFDVIRVELDGHLEEQ